MSPELVEPLEVGDVVRVPVAKLKLGSNVRDHDPLRLKRLAESLRRHGQKELLRITPTYKIVNGFGRCAAAKAEGLEFLECRVVPEVDGRDLAVDQVVTAHHTEGIPAYDMAFAVEDMAATMSNKEIAELLGLDVSSITKYRSLWKCPPEIQAKAKAGKIGLAAWYRESTKPNGPGDENADKPAKFITCPVKGGAVVKVTGDSFESAIATLKAAVRAMEAAKADGLAVSTAESYWLDLAKAK